MVFDPLNSQRPMISENAKPWPAELARKNRASGKDPTINEGPKPNELFCDSTAFRWEEFETRKEFRNPEQVKVDVSKPKKLWFYLGRDSTEARAHFTSDLAVPKNDPSGNFLETIRIATVAATASTVQRKSFPAPHPLNQNAINAVRANYPPQQPKAQNTFYTSSSPTKERPYHGKYAIAERDQIYTNSQAHQRRFQHEASTNPYHSQYQYPGNTYQNYRAPQAPMGSMVPTASMISGRPGTQQPFTGAPDYAMRAHNMSSFPNSSSYVPPRPPPYEPPRPAHNNQSQTVPTPTQPAPYSRPQAPVANMTGSAPKASSPTSQTSFSRPSSAQRRPSGSSSVTAPVVETKQVSHLPVSKEYTYLHDAEMARPKVYQSPYAPEGGFTAAYLPLPAAVPKMRSRALSTSEEFLMKRTLSQQERVNKSLSEDRARAQEEAQALVRQQAQQQAEGHGHIHSRSNNFNQQYHHPQPQHLPMSAIQQPQSSYRLHSPPHYHNPHASANSYQQYNHYSPTYATNALHHHQGGPAYQYQLIQNYQQPPLHPPYGKSTPPQQQSYYSPPPTQVNPGEIQYQSPQDFQLQVQREAQHSSHENSFDHFLKGVHSAAGVHHAAQSDDGGGGSNNNWGENGGSGNGQGSPLKYEMNGGGGEMLPQMREGSRY